jgi:hypothetical protein
MIDTTDSSWLCPAVLLQPLRQRPNTFEGSLETGKEVVNERPQRTLAAAVVEEQGRSGRSNELFYALMS